jgi:hypothetical protein
VSARLPQSLKRPKGPTLERMARVHIRHEVRGMLVAIPPPPLEPAIAESALLHLRIVSQFLTGKANAKHPDDLFAKDYSPSIAWKQPSMSDLLGAKGLIELNKRMAHLSIHRLGGYDWFDLLNRIPEVVDAFYAFLEALPDVPAFGSATRGQTLMPGGWRGSSEACSAEWPVHAQIEALRTASRCPHGRRSGMSTTAES